MSYMSRSLTFPGDVVMSNCTSLISEIELIVLLVFFFTVMPKKLLLIAVVGLVV